MTTSSPSATELLRLPALRELLRSPGPCITVLSPAYRPGESTGSPRAFLAASIREARQKLSAFLPNGALTALLRPLEETAEDPELAAGSHWGRAIFRSPAEFVQFRLIQPVRALSTVAGSFAIRPLMEEWSRPEAFYLLSLSKTKVAVFRCHDGCAEPVKLPSGVPGTLEDALQLEPPDHDLENRSSAGRSTGAMGRVRFGTGSGRETKHAHLADFYKLVDRALTELAGEPAAPLILAGVEEDAAIFRLISGYPNLIGESISGSAGTAEPPQELLQKAHSMLRREETARQARELISDRERVPAERFLTDPHGLLRAAFEGRLAKLYMNREVQNEGEFERGNYHSWGPEDLLNLAAVQTILHHGEVCELAPEEMPPDSTGEKAQAAGTARY